VDGLTREQINQMWLCWIFPQHVGYFMFLFNWHYKSHTNSISWYIWKYLLWTERLNPKSHTYMAYNLSYVYIDHIYSLFHGKKMKKINNKSFWLREKW